MVNFEIATYIGLDIRKDNCEKTISLFWFYKVKTAVTIIFAIYNQRNFGVVHFYSFRLNEGRGKLVLFFYKLSRKISYYKSLDDFCVLLTAIRCMYEDSS